MEVWEYHTASDYAWPPAPQQLANIQSTIGPPREGAGAKSAVVDSGATTHGDPSNFQWDWDLGDAGGDVQPSNDGENH
ncbi:hypothetical protein PGT21_013212 [Puccinia graminis f. sp. tritici]|uniref:Uncharacterized protein n=1 Tax=Puccinia graminis f. sp. tritici TaxID=56615 RepID=A0A5B0LSP9_PUCGR|nr:hypothetical protein PGTUg99_009125 [Puccinia graminis f. sp. tritici]KAA1083975.1 hypothetical protein PGT21_013212 [Puccinia graminis f. sp. tritici]